VQDKRACCEKPAGDGRNRAHRLAERHGRSQLAERAGDVAVGELEGSAVAGKELDVA